MGILCLEDSLEASSLIFPENNEKYLWVSPATVVIGALGLIAYGE